MAKLSAVYASALFDLAVESGRPEEYLEGAALMRDTLGDADCLRALTHPHISAVEKKSIFAKAFGGQVNDDLLGLLNLSIEKNREVYFPDALIELIGLIGQYQRKTTAKVLSAIQLSDTQIAEIKTLLSGKLEKDVSVSLMVDPSAIGGQCINVDGYYVDRTLKSRLRELATHVKETK